MRCLYKTQETEEQFIPLTVRQPGCLRHFYSGTPVSSLYIDPCCGGAPLDGVAAFGSLGTYGFLIVYVLVSVAAPRYLAHRGELKAWNVLCSALAVAMMAMPFAATVGLPLPGSPFPVPAYPYDVLPYAFVLLLAAASAWSLVRPRGW